MFIQECPLLMVTTVFPESDSTEQGPPDLELGLSGVVRARCWRWTPGARAVTPKGKMAGLQTNAPCHGFGVS